MKNIMIFDDCQDYFYDVHGVTEEDFARIFPGPHQNVEFHDDLYARPDLDSLNAVFHRMWFNRLDTATIDGLHGMLFYENWDRKPFYPSRRDIAEPLSKIFPPLDLRKKIILVVDKRPSEAIVTCQVDAALFSDLFGAPHKDIAFFEDLERRLGREEAIKIVRELRNQIISKPAVRGIDGTIYIGYAEKMMHFPNRIDKDVSRHYPLAKSIDASNPTV